MRRGPTATSPDWIGSVTEAKNPGRDEPGAGLSRLEDGSLLRDAIPEP